MPKSRSSSSPNSDSHRKYRKGHGNVNRGSKGPQENDHDGRSMKDTDLVLPSFTPWLVFLVTLTFRVLYVLDSKNWWMVHPDEVYQSMEVAHIEMYGYGFRTFEFSPPESPSDDISRYRQMELRANMYALRSPIFPYFYVLISQLTSLVGIQVNPHTLWRVAHVVISSLLPLAVYRQVTGLYDSSEKGSVAAVLVASSVHLNVLGTHCLIHSFLAPFIFLALSILIDSCSQNSGGSEQAVGCGKHESLRKMNSCLTGLGSCKIKESQQNDASACSNGFSKAGSRFKAVNGNTFTSQPKDLNVENSQVAKENISHFSVCSSPFRPHSVPIATAAFIATLTCYIRPDALLVFGVNLAFFKTRQILRPANMAALSFGTCVGLAVGLGSDFNFYGWGIITPINWVNFNLIKGLSIIFGSSSCWFYFETFFCYDLGTMALSACAMVVCCMLHLKRQNDKCGVTRSSQNESDRKDSDAMLSFKSLLVFVVLLIVYSTTPHKETRFIHDVITLVFVFIADVLVNMKYLSQHRKIYNNAIRFILLLFTVSQWRAFPNCNSNTEWVYQNTENVEEMNSCIKYISEQNDVTGVFYDSSLFMTGGMSLLHHDVTLMSLMKGGFYEFGHESRKNYTKTSSSAGNLNTSRPSVSVKSVNEFTRVSNFISLANSQDVVRVIIRKRDYNYLVLREDRKFLDVGFTETFRTKHYKVYKRSFDEKSEYLLERVFDRISPGTNSTVLLHEGDVLFNMNQFREASKRFYKATTLNETMVEAYFPLQACYSRLGDEKASRAVRARCIALFNEEACSKPRKITAV